MYDSHTINGQRSQYYFFNDKQKSEVDSGIGVSTYQFIGSFESKTQARFLIDGLLYLFAIRNGLFLSSNQKKHFLKFKNKYPEYVN